MAGEAAGDGPPSAAASGGGAPAALAEEEQALLQQRYGTTGFAKAGVFAKITCAWGVEWVACGADAATCRFSCWAPPMQGSRADARCTAPLTVDTFVSPLLALGAKNKVRSSARPSPAPAAAAGHACTSGSQPLALLCAHQPPTARMACPCRPPCALQIKEGTAPAYLPVADTAQTLSRQFDEMYERVKVRALGRPILSACMCLHAPGAAAVTP